MGWGWAEAYDEASHRQKVRTESNPEKVDKFFDDLHGPLSQLAKDIGVDQDFILALSSMESGWYDSHNRGLKNPFGMTKAGGNNLKFSTLESAIELWKKNYSAQIINSATIQDFTKGLLAGPRVYNSVNPLWATKVHDQYRTIVRRKAIWLNKKKGE